MPKLRFLLACSLLWKCCFLSAAATEYSDDFSAHYPVIGARFSLGNLELEEPVSQSNAESTRTAVVQRTRGDKYGYENQKCIITIRAAGLKLPRTVSASNFRAVDVHWITEKLLLIQLDIGHTAAVDAIFDAERNAWVYRESILYNSDEQSEPGIKPNAPNRPGIVEPTLHASARQSQPVNIPGVNYVRPGENLPLIQAVHLINVRTRLQLNLEASCTNPPDLVVFTNVTFESFGQNELFQWAKTVTNYTLLGDIDELELTLVANENLRPGAPLSLSYPLPTFGFTNVEICQMTAALSNAVPFGIEFWSPRPPGRIGNGPLESFQAHWSLRDLRHPVTLPARPRTLRDVLNEVFNPHFKSYWISMPTPPQTATNAIAVQVYRPEDSQAPAYKSDP